MNHLMVVAAGTGGHVMPGLAVAETLRARGWTVSWLGTATGMERGLVEPRGLPFDAVNFVGLRGKGLKTMLFGGFALLRALWQSRAALRARRPRVVFSTGGYVAVPAGLAASLSGVPLVLLNADAAPLLSTKLLKSLTSAVCCGFDGAAAKLAGARALVSGNPVRAEIAALAEPAARYAQRSGPLRVLVLGGSLGAAALNTTVPAALALLPADERPAVVHQCGAKGVEETRAAYARAAVQGEIVPFIGDVATRYAEADVVVCRAGAITAAELCAAGVPAILVPFIASTTDHQRTNAEFLAQHGAAIHLPQSGLTADALARELRSLTRPQLLEMAQKARALGKPQAAATVADAIEHIANAAPRAKGAAA